MREPPEQPRPPEHEAVVQLDAPLASAEWSSAITTQNLEILFVYLAADGARSLRPIQSDALRLGCPPDRKPGEIVLEAVDRYGLSPLLVHSTSWRHDDGRLILTYVAVVEPPTAVSEYLVDEPVGRVELARGDAFAPPPEISVGQVLEHAFRHLAWLVKDDAVVGERLKDWAAFLTAYEPEPFRAFA